MNVKRPRWWRCSVNAHLARRSFPSHSEAAPPPSAPGGIADSVRDRQFQQLIGIVADFGAPVAECGAEAVRRRGVAHTHYLQHAQQRLVVEGLPFLATWKEILGVLWQRVDDPEREIESGTRCSRRIFIRSLGTIHMRPTLSISDRLARSTSDALAAVSIANSRARGPPMGSVQSFSHIWFGLSGARHWLKR